MTKGAKMGNRHSLFVIVSGAALVLAGCESGGEFGSSRPETAATAAADRPAATRLIEREVEAPDVFHRTEAGLWDGRPSLGGVWVAHPEVTDPERVMIRNQANGKTIVGALFRRERDMPGPRFQVSSDAAAGLGLLAGAPVELDVTALRKQEAPAPEAEPEPEASPEAALAAAEPDNGAGPDVAETAAQDTAAAGLADSAGTETEVEAAPVRRGPFAGLFRRKPAEPLSAISETATQATPAAAAPADAAPADAAPLDAADEAAAIGSDALEAIDAAAATEAETPAVATADTEAPVPADTAEAPRRGLFAGLFRRQPDEPLSAISDTSYVASAPVAATAAVAASAAVTTEALAPIPASASASAQPAAAAQPYLQVGRYTAERRATRTADALRAGGIMPVVLAEAEDGRTRFRVLAGPAPTETEQAALLRKVKDLGYEDAYPVAR